MANIGEPKKEIELEPISVPVPQKQPEKVPSR